MGAVLELLRRGFHAITTSVYNVRNVNAPVRPAQRASAAQERVRAVTLCQPVGFVRACVALRALQAARGGCVRQGWGVWGHTHNTHGYGHDPHVLWTAHSCWCSWWKEAKAAELHSLSIYWNIRIWKIILNHIIYKND